MNLRSVSGIVLVGKIQSVTKTIKSISITDPSTGQIDSKTCLMISGHTLKNAQTFSDVNPDSGFWFENSYGLVEIAINRGSAKKEMGLDIGVIVNIN